jgi:hypothetical protein
MAEKRTIELEVVSNSENAQQQFKELRNAIKSTSEEIDDLSKEFGENSKEVDNARKKLGDLNNAYTKLSKNATDLSATFEDIYGELQPLTARMGEAEDRLYELALAGKQGTKEYEELLQTVGKYKRVQMDTDLVVDAASSTMANKLVGALGGVAAGAEVATGTIALMGVESEELQLAILKVQGAMALAQGIQGLKEAQGSFKQLGAVASSTLKRLSSESSLAGKATSALGPVWEAVGLSGETALSGIRAGIAATGIGLLVVALGTIVAYWDDIKAAVSGVSSELKNNIVLSKMQVESAQQQVDLFDLQENSLRLQGKTEKEILQLRMVRLKNLAKEQQEDIKLAENKKKLEIAGAERNNMLLKAYVRMQLELLLLPFRAIALMVDGTILTINQGLKALGKSELKIKTINEYLSDFSEYASDGLASMVFDPKEVAEESDKEIFELKKALSTTKNEIDGAQLEINQITLDNAKTAAANQDAINKAAEAKLKEYNDKLQAYYDAVEAKRQADITDARQKELQAADNKYEALYDLADKAGKDTADLQKQHGVEAAAINKKYDLLEIEAKKEKEKKLQEMMKQMDDASTKQFITAEEIKIAAMEDGLGKEAAIRKLAYDKEQIELQNKLDAELITMEQFQTASRANNKAYQDGITADNEASLKAQVEADMAAYEQKAALQNQYADIANQAANLIKELFGKSKAAQKTAVIVESAAGIAKMVIANKLANLGALATPQAIASSGIAAAPVIAANNISLGLGIAANVAATAKALKEIGGGGSAPSAPSAGGGGGTSGGGTGGGVMAPNFNVVGNNGLNQLAQLQQQPIKAYVVGAEVTTQQALDRNRLTNATL